MLPMTFYHLKSTSADAICLGLANTCRYLLQEKQYYLQQTDALEAEVCSQSERCELLEEGVFFQQGANLCKILIT